MTHHLATTSEIDALEHDEPIYEARTYPFDDWRNSVGIPSYGGYFVSDIRTLELGWWEERQCQAAFIQLAGQEGVSEARVVEIAPGASLQPFRFAIDEIVYVVSGTGLATVWTDDSKPGTTFEWHKHSLFLLPRHARVQLGNARGDEPARLLRYSYLPLAMSLIQEPEYFFNNESLVPAQTSAIDELYSEAKHANSTDPNWPWRGAYWYGNFFPDMRAWDKLREIHGRGAGGSTVGIRFPDSEMSCHMSVFGSRTYKKAHRHGPGRVIVIPAGEGYSIMWQDGSKKVVVPWQEASLFVPPDRWFHQHFNLGAAPARYLALHPLPQFAGKGEKVEDRAKDQIEYTDEEPWIRRKFESELAHRGITTLMPEEAYRDRDYDWKS